MPDSTRVKKLNRFVFPSSFAEILIVTPPEYENVSVTDGGSPKRRVKSVPSHLYSCDLAADELDRRSRRRPKSGAPGV